MKKERTLSDLIVGDPPEQLSVEEVRRYIKELHEKGAPDEKIREFVGHTGYSPEEIRAGGQPWYKRYGQTADDIVRLMAQGLTAGGLDELIGKGEREKTEAAAERVGPVAATGARIAGSLPLFAATRGLSGLALAPKTVGSLPYAMGEGGLYGALESYFGGANPLTGGVYGILTGGIGHGIATGLEGLGRYFRPALKKLFSAGELKSASESAYDTALLSANNSGISVQRDGVRKILSGALSDPKFSVDPKYHPETAKVWNDLNAFAWGNNRLLPVGELEKLNSTAGGIVRGGGEDAKMAGILRDKIKDFLGNLDQHPPGFLHVPPGADLGQVSRSLQNARELWAQHLKTEKLRALEEHAKTTTNAAQSGSEGIKIREGLQKMFEDEPKWWAREQEAFRLANEGTPAQNWAQRAEKLSPTENLWSMRNAAEAGITGAIGAGTGLAAGANATLGALAPWAIAVPALAATTGKVAQKASKQFAKQSLEDIIAAAQRQPGSMPTWMEMLAADPTARNAALALGLQGGPLGEHVYGPQVSVRPWSEVEGQQK